MIKKPFCNIIFLALILVLVSGIFTEAISQCPMCRMAAESNLANGGSEGAGLNKGILYMLAMPYLMVTAVGLIWYRNNKKVNEQESEMFTDNDDNVDKDA